MDALTKKERRRIMKKGTKVMALMLSGILAASTAGCGNPQPETKPAELYQGHNSGLTERTAAEGYYVQYLTCEDLGEAIFGPLSHEGSDVSCFQVNTLVLTNNEFASRGNCAYAYEPGQRYELTKDFRDTQRGMHFCFSFYGTYTLDGDQVTLSEPETFSYNLWTGDGGPIAEPTDAGGFSADPATDPYVDAFNTSIMNYRCSYGHESMTVTIDQENFTFTFNEVNEDD